MNVSRGRRNLKLTTKLWYGLPYCLYLDLEQLLLFLWFCHYDQQQLEEDLQNNVWSGPQILEHSFGHTKQEYLDMYLDIWTNANIKHPSFGVWTVLNQIISGINLPFRQQTILQGWLFLEIPWLRTGNNDFSCEFFSVAATVLWRTVEFGFQSWQRQQSLIVWKPLLSESWILTCLKMIPSDFGSQLILEDTKMLQTEWGLEKSNVHKDKGASNMFPELKLAKKHYTYFQRLQFF